PRSDVGAFPKHIAGPAHRADRITLLAADQSLPQPADVHIDRALVHESVASPYPIQELGTGMHATWAFHQILEQAKLGWTKPDVPRAALHPMCGAVELDVLDLEHVRQAVWRRAAQDSLHPRHQLGQRERLDDIIICAGR